MENFHKICNRLMDCLDTTVYYHCNNSKLNYFLTTKLCDQNKDLFHYI